MIRACLLPSKSLSVWFLAVTSLTGMNCNDFDGHGTQSINGAWSCKLFVGKYMSFKAGTFLQVVKCSCAVAVCLCAFMQNAVITVCEGELVYDYCWFPLMSSYSPDTCW